MAIVAEHNSFSLTSNRKDLDFNYYWHSHGWVIVQLNPSNFDELLPTFGESVKTNFNHLYATERRT